jgi:hypothetical protein
MGFPPAEWFRRITHRALWAAAVLLLPCLAPTTRGWAEEPSALEVPTDVLAEERRRIEVIAGASQAAIEQLMDHEWPLEKRERFLQVVAQHPELRGLHDLRTRTSGNRDFVQFHVWVDGRMTVNEAHRVMDEIEDKLLAAFPGIEILIHPDPEGLVDEAPMGAEDLLARGPNGASPALMAQGSPS